MAFASGGELDADGAKMAETANRKSVARSRPALSSEEAAMIHGVNLTILALLVGVVILVLTSVLGTNRQSNGDDQ